MRRKIDAANRNGSGSAFDLDLAGDFKYIGKLFTSFGIVAKSELAKIPKRIAVKKEQIKIIVAGISKRERSKQSSRRVNSNRSKQTNTPLGELTKTSLQRNRRVNSNRSTTQPQIRGLNKSHSMHR